MRKDLEQLYDELIEVWQHYEKQGTTSWNYRSAVADLPYQLGSLTKAISQLHNERYRDGMSEDEIREKIGDELADIFAEVLFISKGLDIDLYGAWEKMLDSDRRKIKERMK